jgi:uncharacterized protein (TIGR03663 family)
MSKRRTQRSLQPDTTLKPPTRPKPDAQVKLESTPNVPPKNGEMEPAPEPEPRTNHRMSLALTQWLTVERLLWVMIVAVGLTVRVLDLARFSLTDSEAAISNGALGLPQGAPDAMLHAGSFVVGVQALLFALAGASDVTARLAPALAGLVPIIVCYSLRGVLGRWGAMASAALFALSASYLHASRTVNAEIVALAAMLVALAGVTAYLQTRQPRSLLIAAIGLGIGLTAGQAAYTILLIVATFTLITVVLRSSKSIDTPEIDQALQTLRRSPEVTRNAGIAFAITALASATTGLLNPLGLQATINIGADWVSQWTHAATEVPAYYIQALTSYELLPLVFGLGGLVVYLGKGNRSALFFAWWLAVALTFYTLSPVKGPEALLVILAPLLWISGQAIAELFKSLFDDFSLANDGVFILVGLITCGIFGINLGSYAQDGQTNHLVIDGVAVAMLILIGVMAGGFGSLYRASMDSMEAQAEGQPALPIKIAWGAVLRHAMPIVGAVLLAGLSVLFFSASLNLSFRDADDTHEPLVNGATTMEARALKPMLEDLSNRWEGDPHSAAIAADSSIGPALRWYLRDFRSVRYFDTPPVTAREPIVIVAAQSKQPGFNSYASQKLRWRWEKPQQALIGASFLRWLMYRGLHDVPPSYDIIVYAQMK